ncbi:MAG: c-type cytochrome, partial [Mangrovicoccus sp.]
MLRLSLLSCLTLTLVPGALMADPAVPAAASSCVSCHSADGNPLVAGVPILAGQRQDYLISALKAYAEGRR